MKDTIDRGPYAVIGVLLFAVKYNLDRVVAGWGFGRGWSALQYLAPGGTVQTVSREDTKFYATMVALALPFIAAGVVLTLRRLRAAGLPGWLVTVFFLPGVNLLFFVVLCLAPRRPAPGDPPGPAAGLLDRVIPDHRWGSAAVGVLLALVAAVATVLISVQTMRQYGWGLFVALPFAMGLSSVLVYGYHGYRDLRSCLAVSLLSVALAGGALLVLALEGIFCLLMAAPLALPLAALGGAIGYRIQRYPESRQAIPQLLLALLVLAPALSAAEGAAAPPLLAVRTAVTVAAPPERVWPHVVAFADLPEPDLWLFRIGIAYPQRAEIHGRVRYCVFSTGPFVEPIEIWDEPRLLKFAVTEQPPPLREWSPYSQVHAPHLDNYLVSRAGQFRLTPLPDGSTHLEGTTWYENRMWPADYWRPWSDWIVHHIHRRVLENIRLRAEAGVTP